MQYVIMTLSTWPFITLVPSVKLANDQLQTWQISMKSDLS